jgi:hypothetical protein
VTLDREEVNPQARAILRRARWSLTRWSANQGAAPVKLLVTFFVEKGKPLTTPVQ